MRISERVINVSYIYKDEQEAESHEKYMVNKGWKIEANHNFTTNVYRRYSRKTLIL